MRRASTLLLEAALLLSAVVAVIYLVRIILSWFLPIEWYWGGALAAVGGPTLIAVALWLVGHLVSPAKVRMDEVSR